MTEEASSKSRLVGCAIWLAGVLAFTIAAIVADGWFGIPFDTSLRVAGGIASLAIMATFVPANKGERWPWVAIVIAALVNVAIFFTPLMDRPASRGEFMLFAAPDALVLLAARAFTYPAESQHQKAVRQQLMLGLILAATFCAALFSLYLIEPVNPSQ